MITRPTASSCGQKDATLLPDLPALSLLDPCQAGDGSAQRGAKKDLLSKLPMEILLQVRSLTNSSIKDVG